VEAKLANEVKAGKVIRDTLTPRLLASRFPRTRRTRNWSPLRKPPRHRSRRQQSKDPQRGSIDGYLPKVISLTLVSYSQPNMMAIHPLPDHFASLFRKLNPSLSFEVRASSEYNSIKGLLEDRNSAAAILGPSCFLQGSYRQQTAIHSINDVDIVALCQLWYPGSGSGQGFDRDRIFQILSSIA
jgi:hypothetical protein